MKITVKAFFLSVLIVLGLQSCSEKPEIMENSTSLKFNDNGKFKIVQFTDIHWKNESTKCDSVINILSAVLDAEKPDLVVFTGDIAYSKPQKQGWDSVSKIVAERKIPWALILGNHDNEFDMERKDIIPYLQTKPYFLGSIGPDDVHGFGNYILSIKSSKNDSSAAHLYFFDSNAYVKEEKDGSYDWIKFNQIQWYRGQSQKLKEQNNGDVLPALAFFHIPLPEYDELYKSGNYTGRKGEDVCSPKINSGLYCAFIENKEVMGTFVGHDHENDYVGELRNIVLAYGRVSGLDAYGSYERGGRIIELTEGEFKFDTWVRTATKKEMDYHFPNNELYPTENTVFMPAAEVDPKENGVAYKYYEGPFHSAKDVLNATPKEEGRLKNISLEPAKVDDHFAFEFNTYLKVPEKGLYKFKISSDDGAIVYVDDQEVVNNDGSHSFSTKEGVIALSAGFNKLKVLYFEDTQGNDIKLGIQSLTMDYDVIPDSMMFY